MTVPAHPAHKPAQVSWKTTVYVLCNDPARPFLFDVGDRIKFRRIDRAEFDASYREDAT